MTVDEFKKNNPHLSNLEGEDLFNAMEIDLLRKQAADEIIKHIKPFWKTHTLRWLFYVKRKNLMFGKNNWSSYKMCKYCKKGVSIYISFICFDANGNKTAIANCPRCKKELVMIENTSMSHKLYIILNGVNNTFWLFLDKIKLIRRCSEGRYSMFGDEARYVQSWSVNFQTGKTKVILKPRKWREYIFIENPRFKF